MTQHEPNHQSPLVPLAIIAAFIGLAVWMALKTSVEAGL